MRMASRNEGVPQRLKPALYRRSLKAKAKASAYLQARTGMRVAA